MFPSNRSLLMALVAAAALVDRTGAEAQVQQSLKDAWVATSQDLFQVDYSAGAGGLVHENPGDVARSFKALAFETPALGTAGMAARGLIGVDDTKIYRFANGSTELPVQLLFDAGAAPSSLRTVTAVAVTDEGTILFSGYSKPKRVFELWELTEVPDALPLVEPRATSMPQLTDAVFVRAEDVVTGSPLAGGGLLATAGKEILFFPTSGGYLTITVLLDTRALGLKGNTELVSVDLIRETDTLMIATSDRQLLTTPASLGPVTVFDEIPGIASRNCAALKPQRIVVRNARGGDDASSIVTDACGQVLRYDFTQANAAQDPDDVLVNGTGFVALAVGEGNAVTCLANEICTLTSGFTAEIDSQDDSELLVLKFENLCDRRVPPFTCDIGETDASNNLVLNSLLPLAIQNSLERNNVQIKIPPYMFGAGTNGRFGAVLVQADPDAASASATIELDIAELFAGELELDVAVGLSRPTPMLTLLNQDVAAYAPDNPSLPTVRGFEATPITIGVRNPMVGAMRGFSAVIYGLQHDLNPPGPRDSEGGLPQNTILNYGVPPRCDLTYGTQQYIASASPERYFANLVACLFADQETLLTSVIPPTAMTPSGRASLIASLGQVKDKLIKALSGSGPNTGSETFQALLTQLGHFDAQLANTPFVSSLVIYKNELEVRSKVFRFNVTERLYPSLPVGGGF